MDPQEGITSMAPPNAKENKPNNIHPHGGSQLHMLICLANSPREMFKKARTK